MLDTNVVLDWLVFADISLNLLNSELSAGKILLATHPPALCELRRVLGYPALKLDADRQMSILAQYQSQTRQPELPDGFTLQNLMLPAGFPRCRDPDDQHFLALAHHAGAVLVSRDKAVLGVAGRARRFGVRVMSVQQVTEWLRSEDFSISHRGG